MPCNWLKVSGHIADDISWKISIGKDGDASPTREWSVASEVWRPSIERLSIAERRWLASCWPPTNSDWSPAVKSLLLARREFYEAVLGGVPTTTAPWVSWRCPALHWLSLGSIVASSHFESLDRNSFLPIELHPTAPDGDVVYWSNHYEDWPRPRLDELAILVGSDLGDVAVIDVRGNTGYAHSQEFIDLAQAKRQIAGALTEATRRGASVRALTSEALGDILDGVPREHVLIIGALESRPEGGTLLMANDGALDLDQWRSNLAAAHRMGWKPKLKSADLQLCRSSQHFSAVLGAAGVRHVHGSVEHLRLPFVARNFFHLVDGNLLDGSRHSAAAWLMAALRTEATTGRRLS